MKEKYLVVLLCLSLIGCHNIPNNNKLDINQSDTKFNKKSFEDDDLGWVLKGNWSYGTPLQDVGSNPEKLSDPENGTGNSNNNNLSKAVIRDLKSNFTLENKIKEFAQGVPSTSSWQPIQDSNIYPNLYQKNNGLNIKSPLSDTNDSAGLNVSTSDANYKYNSGLPAILENTGISNNSSIVKNLIYRNGTTAYNYFQSNQVGWKTKKKFPNDPNNNDTYSYNFNLSKNNKIEFEFYGTNFYIPHNKGPNPGWNDLKLTLIKGNNNQNQSYSESNTDNINIFNREHVDSLNNTNSSDLLGLSGLKKSWYKVIIESDVSSSAGKQSYLFSFDKVEVFPSYQIELTNTVNITFNYQVSNNMGTSYITAYKRISNDPCTICSGYVLNQTLDMYDSSATPINKVFNMPLGDLGDYIVTVEALPPFYNNSTIHNMNMGVFEKYPFITNDTTYKDPVLYFRTGNDYGKARIFVDKKYFMSVDLNSSSAGDKVIKLSDFDNQYYPIIDINIPHKVTVVGDYDSNLITGKYPINIHAISEKDKATFKFVTDTNNGILDFRGSKEPDMGIVKLSLYKEINSNWNLVSQATSDLYSPSYGSVGSFANNEAKLDYSPNYIYVDSDSKYKVEIEPNYTKNIASKGYKIGVNRLILRSSVDETSKTIADSICE